MFVGDAFEKLYALDLATGEEKWSASAELGFVAPPACPRCAGPMADDDAVPGSLFPRFCDDCRPLIVTSTRDQCPRCAAPVGPNLQNLDGCVHCRNDRFSFEQAVALDVYRGPLQQACRAAKRPGGGVLAAALANLLGERSADVMDRWNPTLVVPVPQFWLARLWQTRHAASVMAEVLARRLRVPCRPDILTKRRWTPAQGRLTPTERRRNLRNAFRADRQVGGKTVLLVDDVLTTGATAHRCAKELKRQGALQVFVAVAARGLGKPRISGASGSVPSLPGRNEQSSNDSE